MFLVQGCRNTMSTNFSDLVTKSEKLVDMVFLHPMVRFHTGQAWNFYLLVLGQVKRNYDSVFTKLFRRRNYPLGPIGSEGGLYGPMWNICWLKKEKSKRCEDTLTEFLYPCMVSYCSIFFSHRSLPRVWEIYWTWKSQTGIKVYHYLQEVTLVNQFLYVIVN